MKPIQFLKWIWPAELLILIGWGFGLCVAGDAGQRSFFLEFLGPIGLLIGSQGAVAFGGPQLKRLQDNNRAQIDNGGAK